MLVRWAREVLESLGQYMLRPFVAVQKGCNNILYNLVLVNFHNSMGHCLSAYLGLRTRTPQLRLGLRLGLRKSHQVPTPLLTYRCGRLVEYTD